VVDADILNHYGPCEAARSDGGCDVTVQVCGPDPGQRPVHAMTAALRATALARSVRTTRDTEVALLRDVSVTVHSGQSLAITGRSGSGKTTLLSVIGMLTPPDAGSLAIAGRDVTLLRDAARASWRNDHVGFVFQAFSLVRHLSAFANVELPLTYGRQVSRRDRRRRVMDLLDQVGLASRARSRPKHLSGGEQQRVAIARALIRQPSVILADEPTGALDVETAASVLSLLRDSCRNAGAALIVVTHDAEVAGAMDSAVELREGQLRPLGVSVRP
jgi:ABC-type lipoprotein export system ATPase subunit